MMPARHTKSFPLFRNHYFNISGLLPCCKKWKIFFVLLWGTPIKLSISRSKSHQNVWQAKVASNSPKNKKAAWFMQLFWCISQVWHRSRLTDRQAGTYKDRQTGRQTPVMMHGTVLCYAKLQKHRLWHLLCQQPLSVSCYPSILDLANCRQKLSLPCVSSPWPAITTNNYLLTMVYNLGPVCISACLSVCTSIRR